MTPNQTLADLTARCLDGPRRRAGRVPAGLRRGPRRHDHGDGRGAGGLLSPRAAGPRRGRPADRQPPSRLGPRNSTAASPALAATLHCAPTEQAAENLRQEGIRPKAIHVTGNTVIDALLWTVAAAARAGQPLAGEIRRIGRPPDGPRSPATAARTSATAWSRSARRSASSPAAFPTSTFSIPCISTPTSASRWAGCCRTSRTSSSASRRPTPSSSG